jgi:hypothetical protein
MANDGGAWNYRACEVAESWVPSVRFDPDPSSGSNLPRCCQI